MIGGAWYDEYVGTKNHEQIYDMALGEIKKQLNIEADPDYHEVTIMKVLELNEFFDGLFLFRAAYV